MRNAFRPQTIIELMRAFEIAREDPEVGVILFTGEGASPSARAATRASVATPATCRSRARVGRFHVTDLQVQIRRLPKPIIAMVAATRSAAGTCCTLLRLTIAADNARFGQTGRGSAP